MTKDLLPVSSTLFGTPLWLVVLGLHECWVHEIEGTGMVWKHSHWRREVRHAHIEVHVHVHIHEHRWILWYHRWAWNLGRFGRWRFEVHFLPFSIDLFQEVIERPFFLVFVVLLI